MVYELAPPRTALLIVDAQREYFDENGALFTPHAAEIRENLVTLLDAARESATQVIFIRHVIAADGSDTGRMGDFDDEAAFVAGTKGVELIPELAPLASEPIVDKTRYSAFVNTRLESILKTSGVDTLIVTGLMTQYCSVTTTRHGHDLDYRMVFVIDANAGPDLPDLGFGAVPHADARRVIATALAGGIADVITASEAIAALTGAAPSA
ncbi:MAG: cysteine hydrolase family protein [Solirubrobacteraceae bacterium]